MNILCVIPSRLSSKRLPRKPLLPIQGKPMIQWVYENARRCKHLTEIVVATDSEEIAELVRSIGGTAKITEKEILTGSDRVAFIAANYKDMDIVINLQGDEPFIRPSMLQQLISPYLDGQMPAMTTLATPFDTTTNYANPGIVKVITDLNNHALYFSRAPIPYGLKNDSMPVYHHKGVYAFRREFLLLYNTLPQTPLEKAENLEQLRALEHGFTIKVCITPHKTLDINTYEDYALAQEFPYDSSY